MYRDGIDLRLQPEGDQTRFSQRMPYALGESEWKYRWYYCRCNYQVLYVCQVPVQYSSNSLNFGSCHSALFKERFRARSVMW